MDGYLANLRLLGQVPWADFASDVIRIGAAKYYLQVAIECCVDIANHLIARNNWRAPRSYADSFSVLAENGVLPEDFLDTTRRMVGIRNRLVHLYWEVDAAVVYETLHHGLEDFEQFRAAVYDYLKKTGVVESGRQRP